MSNHPCYPENPRPVPNSPRRPSHRPRPFVDVFLGLLPVLFLALAAAGPARAAPVPGGAPAVHAAANCQGNATCDLDATLTNIQYFLVGIAVLIAGVAFAFFGIQHMTGAFEDKTSEDVKKRNTQLKTIAMGLVVTLLSAVLVGIAKGLIVTS